MYRRASWPYEYPGGVDGNLTHNSLERGWRRAVQSAVTRLGIVGSLDLGSLQDWPVRPFSHWPCGLLVNYSVLYSVDTV